MIIDRRITKDYLYALVDSKLRELGIRECDYPLNSLDIARQQPKLNVEFLNFKTTNIGGTLYKGDTESSLGVNILRSEKGRNFDCMHELIHFWFHPAGAKLCYGDNFVKQNRFIEWQANEGAAQGLMPKDLFMRKYLLYSGGIKELSDFFIVGELAIRYRIASLGLGEIQREKIIDKPIILRDIHRVKKMHCKVCGNVEVTVCDGHCSICGSEFVRFGSSPYWILYNEGPAGRNFCSSKECKTPLKSNARFCTYCGEKSIFFAEGRLKDWETQDLEQRIDRIRM